MCTVVSYEGAGSYVARNLDVAFSYNEEAVFAPRNVQFNFRHLNHLHTHHAIIGIATRFKDMPLFYEAANEHGLFMAGLNFPNNAIYYDYKENHLNLAPWELIPYILGSFKTVDEVKEFTQHLNIIDEAYMEGLPNSPLHFYICDKKDAIIIETMKDGMHVYDATYKTMTNNPPYPFHKKEADEVLKNVSNEYKKSDSPTESCVGLSGLGLPGDYSSKSRFKLAAFLAKHQTETSLYGEIMNGIRIMNQVSMVKGCVKCEDGKDDYTVYSVVYDLTNFNMYYKLYDSVSTKKVKFDNIDIQEKTFSYESLVKETF